MRSTEEGTGSAGNNTENPYKLNVKGGKIKGHST
jgi:hypothetical protein